ncbi:hypothetical protein, partial [Petrachloros mirabilis]
MAALIHFVSVIYAIVLAAGVIYSFVLLGRAVRSMLPDCGWSPSVTVLWDVFIGLGIGAFLTSVL